MTNLEMMKDALKRSQDHLASNPTFLPFDVVIRQLKYLIDLEEGKTSETDGLEHISLGRIAARELDGFEDNELREHLYKIASYVREFKKSPTNKTKVE